MKKEKKLLLFAVLLSGMSVPQAHAGWWDSLKNKASEFKNTVRNYWSPSESPNRSIEESNRITKESQKNFNNDLYLSPIKESDGENKEDFLNEQKTSEGDKAIEVTSGLNENQVTLEQPDNELDAQKVIESEKKDLMGIPGLDRYKALKLMKQILDEKYGKENVNRAEERHFIDEMIGRGWTKEDEDYVPETSIIHTDVPKYMKELEDILSHLNKNTVVCD
jgi:hypothetical protein